MSRDGDSEPDVRARIGKAASIFQRFRPIWSSTTINYACETWKRTAMIAHRLDVFHRRCLRAILGMSWRGRVTNEEATRRAGMERLQDIVTTRRRKMAGHILRLQRGRPSQTAMYWVTEDGRRRHGEAPSKKTSKRWVLAGMEPAASPVTVMDGGFSLPYAPRGTGGPKSN